MSRRKKILVVAVLVLVAVLYATSALGWRRDGRGDAGDDPGGVVDWLGDLVGGPPAVDRSDLSAPCLAGDTLTVDGTCTLHVAGSDEDTRQVALHAYDRIRVTARPPRGDGTASSTVDPGKDIKVTVDGDGGDIALECLDSDTCTVTLP